MRRDMTVFPARTFPLARPLLALITLLWGVGVKAAQLTPVVPKGATLKDVMELKITQEMVKQAPGGRNPIGIVMIGEFEGTVSWDRGYHGPWVFLSVSHSGPLTPERSCAALLERISGELRSSFGASVQRRPLSGGVEKWNMAWGREDDVIGHCLEFGREDARRVHVSLWRSFADASLMKSTHVVPWPDSPQETDWRKLYLRPLEPLKFSTGETFP